jgi:hypothetical protein
MKIFNEIKQLVRTEKLYTAKILTKLMIVEKDKLYSDLKYSSLHKYIIKELGYSEAESTIRLNAVRLMLKSTKAKKQIENGTLTLTNAAEANKVIQQNKNPALIDRIVDQAGKTSTRKFKETIAKEFGQNRREVLILQEHMIKKFDKLRKIYGDLSSYELLSILLEKELNAPSKMQRVRPYKAKNSRSIPKQVKAKVYTGKCNNCGVKHGLEYDHILKYSHGGTNSSDNIQMLCRNCNQRKEILSKKMGFFN